MTSPHEPTDSQIENLLLTAQEMHEVYERLDRDGKHGPSEPMELVIDGGEKQLVFLGTHHSNNPERPDLPILLERWNEFLSSSNGKDRIVLVEGGLPRDEASQEAAIREASETGLFNYLAKKSGVEVISPEPDRLGELQHLEKEVGRDEAMYYYFARTAAQWQRTKPETTFEEYLDSRLERYKELSGWDYDFSVEHMAELYEEKHGQPFNPEHAMPHEDYSPSGSKASEVSGKYRDVHIVREILKLWNEGKSIFMTYGDGHLIVQERALKALLK